MHGQNLTEKALTGLTGEMCPLNPGLIGLKLVIHANKALHNILVSLTTMKCLNDLSQIYMIGTVLRVTKTHDHIPAIVTESVDG